MKTITKPTAALMFTGGKYCFLVYMLYKDIYDIKILLTMAPKNAHFISHPIDIIKMQARALNINHKLLQIEEDAEKSYNDHFASLADMGIECILSGDAPESVNCAKWMKSRCETAGLAYETPIYNRSKKEIVELFDEFAIIMHLTHVDSTTHCRFMDKPYYRGILSEFHGIDINSYHCMIYKMGDFAIV